MNCLYFTPIIHILLPSVTLNIFPINTFSQESYQKCPRKEIWAVFLWSWPRLGHHDAPELGGEWGRHSESTPSQQLAPGTHAGRIYWTTEWLIVVFSGICKYFQNLFMFLLILLSPQTEYMQFAWLDYQLNRLLLQQKFWNCCFPFFSFILAKF